MNIWIKLGVLLSALTMWGCATAPQQNIEPSSEFWERSEKKVGVYVSDIPLPKGHIAGASCLLCIATATAVNSNLNEHISAQSNEDLLPIHNELIESIEGRGFQTVKIDAPIDYVGLPKNPNKKAINASPKDFSSIKKKYDIDYLVYVDLKTLGTMRNFSGYIPVGDPYALFNGAMYIVDLAENTFVYYETINVEKYAEGEWKQVPDYTNITNAYYTAIEEGRDHILDLKAIRAKIDENLEELEKMEANLKKSDNNG